MSQWLKSQPSNNTVSGVISSPSLYSLYWDEESKLADDLNERDWKIVKRDGDAGSVQMESEAGNWKRGIEVGRDVE